MPFLSIVTINYNNAAGLKKTIGSVRAQTFADYEHIIVDGGSTDGSVDVIQDALADADYARLVSWWCSEKDGGIYSAMNKGITHAGGKWVYMLNSGDALVDGALSRVAPVLAMHPDEVVYGAVDCYKAGEFERTACQSAEQLRDGMIPHQGTFVPAKVHGKFGLYDEGYKILADRELMIRLKTGGVQFFHVPLVVCEYDVGGISATSGKQVAMEARQIERKYFGDSFSLLGMCANVAKQVLRLVLPGIVIVPIRTLYRVLCRCAEKHRGGVALCLQPAEPCLGSAWGDAA